MRAEYKPRLSIDITEDMRDRLYKHLDYGMRKPLFHFIINTLIKYFDEYGAHKVIAAIIGKHIELKDILGIKLKKDK